MILNIKFNISKLYLKIPNTEKYNIPTLMLSMEYIIFFFWRRVQCTQILFQCHIIFITRLVTEQKDHFKISNGTECEC